MRHFLIAGLLYFAAGTGFAQEACRDNFTEQGVAMLSDKKFQTWAVFPIANEQQAYRRALAQVQRSGYPNAKLDSATGTIHASSPLSLGRTAPYTVYFDTLAHQIMRVTISYVTPAGVVSPQEAIQSFFCNTLAEVGLLADPSPARGLLAQAWSAKVRNNASSDQMALILSTAASDPAPVVARSVASDTKRKAPEPDLAKQATPPSIDRDKAILDAYQQRLTRERQQDKVKRQNEWTANEQDLENNKRCVGAVCIGDTLQTLADLPWSAIPWDQKKVTNLIGRDTSWLPSRAFILSDGPASLVALDSPQLRGIYPHNYLGDKRKTARYFFHHVLDKAGIQAVLQLGWLCSPTILQGRYFDDKGYQIDVDFMNRVSYDGKQQAFEVMGIRKGYPKEISEEQYQTLFQRFTQQYGPRFTPVFYWEFGTGSTKVERAENDDRKYVLSLRRIFSDQGPAVLESYRSGTGGAVKTVQAAYRIYPGCQAPAGSAVQID